MTAGRGGDMTPDEKTLNDHGVARVSGAKWFAVVIVILGWFAAVAFTAWALYTRDHPTLACIVALAGAASPSLGEVSRS